MFAYNVLQKGSLGAPRVLLKLQTSRSMPFQACLPYLPCALQPSQHWLPMPTHEVLTGGLGQLELCNLCNWSCTKGVLSMWQLQVLSTSSAACHVTSCMHLHLSSL